MKVITTHTTADFDGLASMVAARRFYTDAVLCFPGAQERTVREFLSTFSLPVEFHKPGELDLDTIDFLILVDTKKPSRIGVFAEAAKKKHVKIHIYDHHPFSENDIRGEREIIEEVGAVTTIFTEMIQAAKIPISPLEATLFALGIYEETGSLVYPSTTERDLRAAAFLVKRGANLSIVSNFISQELNQEQVALLNDFIKSARDYYIHGIKVTVARARRNEFEEDIAYLTHKLREFEDTDALVLLVRVESKTYIIFRSQVAELDVASVAKVFGGGGHPTAASASIKDESLDEIESMLVETLKKHVNPLKIARDIMTTPVKTIAHNCTVKEAEQMLTKYEINVLPVIENQAFLGLITRENVEKALFHGFGSSPVLQFCATDVHTARSDTPVSEIEDHMIGRQQRFVPVLEGKYVKGAITRTDILRNIYEGILRKHRNQESSFRDRPSISRNLTSSMKEKFPQEVFHTLKQAAEVAENLGFSAYLVGGTARDLLRGEANLDIDIVIEGDGIRFARALAELLGGRVKIHKYFKTASVITDSIKLDIATSRTEYYEHPGALPIVEASSIKKDLYRRDFTINTLAVRLSPSAFGELLDFFGGRGDIKEKTIKVLHSLSFIEDPTRAFRSVRFSERFGYKITRHTQRLIKTAVSMNVFSRVSGQRLWEEFKLLLLETEPYRALVRLEELDLLKTIHPELKVSKALYNTMYSLHEVLTWFRLLFLDENVDKGQVYFLGILEGLKTEHQNEVLKRLLFPQGTAGKYLHAIKEAKNALYQLQQSIKPSAIFHTLKPLNIETILLCMGLSQNQDIKRKISLYLTELRKIKCSLKGKDLQQMGLTTGPLIGRLLKAVFEARLDSVIKSKEEEIAFVEQLLQQSHYT
jgi:tRNA nucleotidyltransferase (CCA-adding enzyme)